MMGLGGGCRTRVEARGSLMKMIFLWGGEVVEDGTQLHAKHVFYF
jgi:hypothetical protein